MSFGLFKNGVNSTDKKLIKRYVAAGWSVDKISAKLSVRPPVIERIIAHQEGTSAAVKPEVEAPEPVEEAAPVAKAKTKAKTAAKAK